MELEPILHKTLKWTSPSCIRFKGDGAMSCLKNLPLLVLNCLSDENFSTYYLTFPLKIQNIVPLYV